MAYAQPVTWIKCTEEVVQDMSMQLEAWLVERICHDNKNLLQV